MRASTILLFGKTKAFFGKDTARKKTAFLQRYLWKMKEKPTNLNRGGMFFSEVEGHMQKLSSFGRGKKFGLKSHLRGSSTQPFKFLAIFSRQSFGACKKLATVSASP